MVLDRKILKILETKTIFEIIYYPGASTFYTRKLKLFKLAETFVILFGNFLRTTNINLFLQYRLKYQSKKNGRGCSIWPNFENFQRNIAGKIAQKINMFQSA